MKILHLLYESKDDYFGIGGVGIRAYEIYKHLRDRHDITLLCKKYIGAEDKEIEGFRHIFVGTESKSLTKTLLFYAYHASLFVKRYGDEFDIIIEEFSPAIPTFLHAFTKKPLILQVQGHTGRLYFRKYNPAYALVLSILEYLRPGFYDNFIFISSETLKKLFLGRKKFFEIIPSGVSPELFTIPPDTGTYILYLGRIDICGKGLDILIKAYDKFFKAFPHIKLVIAGDGRDRERLKTQLTKISEDLRKNIVLVGWVSGNKKIEVIDNALFCVFPSRHEVQSIATLEVMARGKAVIVSDIPEFSYISRIGAGISFRTGDALTLAESMEKLMTDNERRKMGERGRDWVKNYTWDRIALKYEEFLHKVLERG
ncbi:MAG: glycosyltransferase family 4 protein [Nitrospirota bacterium]